MKRGHTLNFCSMTHNMTNTMRDLRREVATRMRDTLHGREIDLIEGVMPRIPHMLGITPLNSVHDATKNTGTLLDPETEFWQSYEKEILTGNDVESEIEAAIRSLKESGVYRSSYPHGEEAGIIYVEVDKMNHTEMFETVCNKCGEPVDASLSIAQTGSGYSLQMTVDCDNCGHSGLYERPMVRK